MQRSPIVSDALLQDLIAAGQADIVVGIATFNDAATLPRVLDAVLESFTTTLLRERTVLVAADGGSGDGTLDLVLGTAGSDAMRPFRHPLRTVHRIGSTYPGGPNAKAALRVLLAATELLGAKALVLVDPADTSLGAADMTALARAPFRDGHDLATPVLPRAPSDGPLVTQLVRPLVRALWGRRVAEPVSLPVSCSGRLAADVAKRSSWAVLPDGLAATVWLTTWALGGSWRVFPLSLPERAPSGPRRGRLPDVFAEIVSTLFESAAGLPEALLARDGSEDLPVIDPAVGWLQREVRLDAAAEGAAFRSARPLLEPLWAQILAPDTLAGVLREDGDGVPGESLWVTTVYDFLLAGRRALMPKDQLARALLPLYQGRVASFLASIRSLDTGAAAARLDALALEFERQKPVWRAALGGTAR